MKRIIIAAIAATIIGVGLAGVAHAHNPEVVVDCDHIFVDFAYYEGGDLNNRITVTVDGEQIHTSTFGWGTVRQFPLVGTGHDYRLVLDANINVGLPDRWDRVWEGTTPPCQPTTTTTEVTSSTTTTTTTSPAGTTTVPSSTLPTPSTTLPSPSTTSAPVSPTPSTVAPTSSAPPSTTTPEDFCVPNDDGTGNMSITLEPCDPDTGERCTDQGGCDEPVPENGICCDDVDQQVGDAERVRLPDTGPPYSEGIALIASALILAGASLLLVRTLGKRAV